MKALCVIFLMLVIGGGFYENVLQPNIHSASEAGDVMSFAVFSMGFVALCVTCCAAALVFWRKI